MAGKRGGRRPGAGRPLGTGKFGEPTKAVRIPASMANDLPVIVRQWQRMRDVFAQDASQEWGQLRLLQPVGAVPTTIVPFHAAAGRTAIAQEEPTEVEEIDLHQALSRHPESTFVVEVRGNSMIDAGIHPGNWLMIDRAEEAISGRIVLAIVDDKVMVKRLQVDPSGIVLLSENQASDNPDHEPIQITESNTVSIVGVVVSVIHRLVGPKPTWSVR